MEVEGWHGHTKGSPDFVGPMMTTFPNTKQVVPSCAIHFHDDSTKSVLSVPHPLGTSNQHLTPSSGSAHSTEAIEWLEERHVSIITMG